MLLVALVLLGALVHGLSRYGHHHGRNSPYHPLEHISRYQSSSLSSHGDKIEHPSSQFKKDYKYYDSWSESEIEPKRNEALFVARTLQTQTKKYIKNRLHHGPWPNAPHHNWKAYCDAGPTQARCQLFVCYATQGLVNKKQFSKHLSQKKICPDTGKYPALAITKAEHKKSALNAEFRVVNPHGVHDFVNQQYQKAKKLCHKTRHTTDDRCKAEVLCLTLEIFPSVWPELFALKNCDATYFMTRDPRSPKLKNLNKSDYKDFPRLKGHKDGSISLLPTDEESLSTRFKHHLRAKGEQKGIRTHSEQKSRKSSESSSN